MGRHEKAVVASTRQLADLALWLRAQRQVRGLTYAAMAEQSDYTSTALSRACSGRTVPTWKLTEAYARICGADLRTARRLWRNARWAEHRCRQEAQADAFGGDIAAKWYDVLATQPRLISDYVNLRRAMIGLRARGGQPSLAQLQELAGRTDGGGWLLPASSLGAILRAEAVPDLRHILAFVRAMGDGRRETEWVAAWNRAERGDTIATPRSWYQGADMPGFEEARRKSTTVSFRVSVLAPAPAPDTATGAARPRFHTLTSGDRNFLHSHGLTVHELNENGPVANLPFGGYTPSGLPIRVPRRTRAPRWATRPSPP
ncbi:helix-turn-helix domain-containing protein [Kitasatospora sp. NA04385]|uniref:helix-turn-helix domain-containing protein n=1 Tax=Kitasatospora sp. NA04385 TaxID=2742135 RepID=UPI0015908925|nr:helix-turn-helix transcriptional regulator [Kitasatospora sp. NA04385]QKW17925.1 helix-turn-helix domain-containing protein [Kitasatospora sp. NA04385]